MRTLTLLLKQLSSRTEIIEITPHAANVSLQMSETNAVDGDKVKIVIVGATACDMATVAAQQQLSSTKTLAQYDSITLVYATDRWVEDGGAQATVSFSTVQAAAAVETVTDTTSTNTITAAMMKGVYFIDDTDDEARDVDIIDGECNAAGDVGNWVVIKKVHSDDGVVSITSNDASNYFILADDTPTTAGDELDMGTGNFHGLLNVP